VRPAHERSNQHGRRPVGVCRLAQFRQRPQSEGALLRLKRRDLGHGSIVQKLELHAVGTPEPRTSRFTSRGGAGAGEAVRLEVEDGDAVEGSRERQGVELRRGVLQRTRDGRNDAVAARGLADAPYSPRLRPRPPSPDGACSDALAVRAAAAAARAAAAGCCRPRCRHGQGWAAARAAATGRGGPAARGLVLLGPHVERRAAMRREEQRRTAAV